MTARAPALTILGSGTAIPTRRRGPTALVVDDGRDAVLVDPGPGAIKRACDAGYPLPRLQHVLLTHHHPDHCLDLIALLFALKNPTYEHPEQPLTVIGGPGTASLIERFSVVFGGWVTLPPERLSVREIGPGDFDLTPGVAARAFAIQHSPASLAYRLSVHGVTLALSGDTELCDGAVAVARDADHYLLEAAMPDDRPMPGHLVPSVAAAIARDARCRHLILTHFYPPVDVDAARRVAAGIFPGRITIAEDGMIIPLVASCDPPPVGSPDGDKEPGESGRPADHPGSTP